MIIQITLILTQQSAYIRPVYHGLVSTGTNSSYKKKIVTMKARIYYAAIYYRRPYNNYGTITATALGPVDKKLNYCPTNSKRS
jgi:hypothetical protein